MRKNEKTENNNLDKTQISIKKKIHKKKKENSKSNFLLTTY